MRPTRGYALLVGKTAPHLTATKADHFPGYRINVSSGQVRGLNWSMAILAQQLTSVAVFPVVDQTGLGGSYDIGFSYAPADSDSSLPSLPDALRETTGLILKPKMVPVETVVIESVDGDPAEN